MHPAILLDLLQNGYLTKEQLSVDEKEAIQVLMCNRAIAGWLGNAQTDLTKPKPIPKPEIVPTTEAYKHGKLLGKTKNRVGRPKKVA